MKKLLEKTFMTTMKNVIIISFYMGMTSIISFANDFNNCYVLVGEDQLLCFSKIETNRMRSHFEVSLYKKKTLELISNLGEYALITRKCCINCNENLFAKIFNKDSKRSENETNTIFDDWSPVQFHGKLDFVTNLESGVVVISDKKFNYINHRPSFTPHQELVSK